jgi:biopolymer transport protein ExbB/TolQ
LEATLNQTLSPLDSLLLNIVLVTLAVGLPIVVVLSIRFLWDRNVNLGRSKELEKLIWQLHRIASAMEQQMNLSFPAVQPGTEDRRDAAYLQQRAAQPNTAARSSAAPSAATQAAPAQQPASEEALPALERRAPSAEAPRAGVNSMFGL